MRLRQLQPVIGSAVAMIVTVPAGESANPCPFCRHCLKAFWILADRDVVLIALGGGVVGDLVGRCQPAARG